MEKYFEVTRKVMTRQSIYVKAKNRREAEEIAAGRPSDDYLTEPDPDPRTLDHSARQVSEADTYGQYVHTERGIITPDGYEV